MQVAWGVDQASPKKPYVNDVHTGLSDIQVSPVAPTQAKCRPES